MTLTEYVDLVANTNKDVFCQDELLIEDNFDVKLLLKLCPSELPDSRLKVAWDMIVSAVAEKFKDSQLVDFFPESILEFLIENKIALSGLSHIRLPKKYLQKIYEKDNRCWEALKNIQSIAVYWDNGNIVKKREFAKASLKDGLLLEEEDSKDTAYVYEGDRLVSYGGADFVYDVMGNPTTYRNMSCVWEKGRQLKNISDGANTVSFTYDEFGMRTTKTAGGITTNYVYENGKLLREVTGSEKIDFVYGSDGIIGFRTGNKNYLYRKNVFGDVTEIYSDNGTLVGKYSYTAFGECIVKVNEGGIAEKNPIRYRGYYYDTETSLYYLKTRYYDPEVGRFMTIDGIEYLDPETINGLNLYAYCGNNPVMNIDPEGKAFLTIFLITLVAGVVIGGTIAGVKGYKNGERGWGLVKTIAKGSFKGGIIGGLTAVLIYALPEIGSFLGASLGFGSLALAESGAAAVSLTSAQAIIAGIAALSGLGLMFSRTGKSNGYWGEKYSNDHDPEHFHFKGTDGTDIRIGTDGNPLKGEKGLTAQQRKALKNLWDQILKLFK